MEHAERTRVHVGEIAVRQLALQHAFGSRGRRRPRGCGGRPLTAAWIWFNIIAQYESALGASGVQYTSGLKAFI
jgi:hypothetical protein